MSTYLHIIMSTYMVLMAIYVGAMYMRFSCICSCKQTFVSNSHIFELGNELHHVMHKLCIIHIVYILQKQLDIA